MHPHTELRPDPVEDLCEAFEALRIVLPPRPIACVDLDRLTDIRRRAEDYTAALAAYLEWRDAK